MLRSLPFDSNRCFERAKEVAFSVNNHMDRHWQREVLDESMRVAEQILAPKDMPERKILIVGGAGYIGTVVTGHLLDAGYSVRCLDALVYNNQFTVLPFLGRPGYEFLPGDLANEQTFLSALDGVSDVVLLAGLVGDPVTKKFPDAAARINDHGHDTMLKLLNGRGLNRVIFVSTCSNYGMIEGDVLADENFELKPLSLYAHSKVRFEKAFLDTSQPVDYTPTVLRFATAFGLSPRMRFDLTVSEFTRALYRGEDLLVYDGHTWRPYCHVRDFAELIRRCLEATSERVAFDVFNAGGEVNNFTKQMIVDAVLAQVPGATVRYQDHGSDPRNYRVNFDKVRNRLLFQPSKTVHDGIAELVAALRAGLFQRIDQPPSFFGNYQLEHHVNG